MSPLRTRQARTPYKVGDTVTGTTYVEPEDRRRERPVEFTGTIAQVGAGWDGMDAAIAYLWVRLESGLEIKALIRDVEHVR
ncbi:hypothetical protein ACE1OC_41045 [Streptomyces sp. DSM 116496]|uniref:hypothetical protein n=1 Tax=Streptomyces stoeckheimensis TaxID=3344656 RepID=UPI0038B3D569